MAGTRTRAQAAPAEAPPRQRRQRPAASVAAPAPVRQRRQKPAEAAPVASPGRDLSQYQNYEPTAYHKIYATWLVKEVGYRPSAAASAKEAFLQGVALATACRPTFNDSEFLEEWREKNGVAKRGPKPKAAVEPEPIAEDDDFDEDDEIDEDDDSDFDEDDDESDADDDDDYEDEVPEPAPVARRTRTAKAVAPVKAAPAKATTRRAKPADEEFVF